MNWWVASYACLASFTIFTFLIMVVPEVHYRRVLFASSVSGVLFVYSILMVVT